MILKTYPQSNPKPEARTQEATLYKVLHSAKSALQNLVQDQNTISTGTPATDNLSSVNLYFNYGVFPPSRCRTAPPPRPGHLD